MNIIHIYRTMRKYKIFISAILIPFFISCEKGSDTEEEIQNHKRVSQLLFEHEGEPYRKIDLSYQNDKLLHIDYFYMGATSWRQDYHSKFIYREGGFTHEYYYIKNDEFRFVRKNDYKVENGKLIEDIYSSGSLNEWHQNAIWSYFYENDQLVSYSRSNFQDGNWKEKAYAHFIYEESKIKTHKYYEIYDGEHILIDCDTFYWDNNHLSRYIDFNRRYGIMELNSKSNFSYEGDLITEILLQARRRDAWSFYQTTYYSYDDEGLLTSERTTWDEEMKISYEEGSGNFHLIFYMPELIAFNKPMFTNAGGSKSASEYEYLPGYPDQAVWGRQMPFLSGGSRIMDVDP